MRPRYEVRVQRSEGVGGEPEEPPVGMNAEQFLSWLDALDGQIVEGAVIPLARRSSLRVALRTFDRLIWNSKRFAKPDGALRFEVYDRKRRETVETGRRYG